MGIVMLLLRKPFSVILHGMDIRLAQTTPVKKWLTKRILKKAEVIVVNSINTQSVLDTLGDFQAKTLVIRPKARDFESLSAAQESHYAAQYPLPAGKKILLSVNRLVARKGNDTAIDALALLTPDALAQVCYVIVGSGVQYEVLKKQVDDLQLTESVLFFTDVENAALPYFYSQATLFLLPAREENGYDVEGYGLSVLEAGLFHLPSIGGASGGVPEVIDDQKSGLLVPPRDPQSLVDAIRYMLEHPEQRAAMGEAAYQKALHPDFASQVEVFKKKTQ